MSIAALVFSVVFFSLLGLAWVSGLSFVRKHLPDYLVPFYMLMAAVRFVSILTVIGIYAFCISESRENTLSFAALFLIMYVVMMVVTLIFKHE